MFHNLAQSQSEMTWQMQPSVCMCKNQGNFSSANCQASDSSTSPEVFGPFIYIMWSQALRNWMHLFQSGMYVAKVNGHQKGACYNEIGLLWSIYIHHFQVRSWTQLGSLNIFEEATIADVHGYFTLFYPYQLLHRVANLRATFHQSLRALDSIYA